MRHRERPDEPPTGAGEIARHEVDPGEAHHRLTGIPGVPQTLEPIEQRDERGPTLGVRMVARLDGHGRPGRPSGPLLVAQVLEKPLGTLEQLGRTGDVLGDVLLERQVPGRIRFGCEVAKLLRESELVAVVADRVLRPPVPIGDPAGGSDRSHPRRCRSVGARQPQRGLGEVGRLLEPAGLLPEPPHRSDEPLRELHLA